MTKPIIYDHQYSVCVLDGLPVTEWSDAADAFSLTPVDPAFTLTQGIGGACITFSGKESETLVIKVLPESTIDKALRLRYKLQKNSKTFSFINGTFLDLINGTSITMTGGCILTKSPFNRGNAYNESVWSITFTKVDIV